MKKTFTHDFERKNSFKTNRQINYLNQFICSTLLLILNLVLLIPAQAANGTPDFRLNQTVFKGSFGWIQTETQSTKLFLAPTTITIGSGTNTQRFPLGHLWGYERSAGLYNSTELTGVNGNQITKLAWYSVSGGSQVPTKVYLKTTTSNSLTADTWANMINGAALVYDASVTPASNTWNTITLSTPFSYSGNNLLVLVETNYGGSGGGTNPTIRYTATTNAHQQWTNDSTPPTGNGSVNTNRPNLQITYDTPSAPCSGTPTAGTASVTPASGLPGSNYTVSASGFTNATGLTFQWQYRTSTDDGSTWSGWTSLASSNSYSSHTATAPAIGTWVRWRLVVSCGTNSANSVVATFKPSYCTPSYPSGVEPITNFTFEGINNTTSASTSSPGYEDFSAISTNGLQAGQQYNFSLEGNTNGDYITKIRVFIDWDNNGFTTEYYYTGTDLINSTGVDGKKSTGVITIPVGQAPGNYRLRATKRFSSYATPCNNSGYGQTEDYTIKIASLPACSGTPTAGTASVTPASGLPGSNYTVSASGFTNATGLTFQWQYRTSTDDGGTWSGWTSLASSNSYSSYTATAPAFGTWVQWRLKVSCGTNSANSGTATFKPSYCTPSSTNTSDYISNFSTTGGQTNISNLNSGLSSGGYGDFYNTHSASYYPGGQVDFAETYVGGTHGFNIWIDYNNNGVFEPSERYYNGNGASTGYSSLFFIPNNQPPGNYRMRIRAVYNNSNPDPCNQVSWGEAEDYKLVVLSQSLCSGAPTGGTTVLTPNNGSPGIPFSATVTGASSGSGLTFQWQSAAAASGPWNDITGEINSTYNGTAPANTTYYRRSITCTNSSSTSYSTAVPFTVINPCNDKIVMQCNTTYTKTLIMNSGVWKNYTGITYNYTGSEQVFEYTAPQTGSYIFEVSQGANDADFILLDACTNTATNLINNGLGYWTGEQPSETISLTQGVTYYLIADLYEYAYGNTTVSVKVRCPGEYCSPSIDSFYSAYINYINDVRFLGTLNDVTNTSTYSNNPNGYQDFTTLPNKSIQAQGEGINVYTKTENLAFYKAWVDWNKDGDFYDSGELVYESGDMSQYSTTFGFVVPVTANPGEYRIRIRTNDYWGNENFDSCEVLDNWGETEDYLFTVIQKCNAKITSVTNGSNCGPGNVDVIANGNSSTTKIRWYDQEIAGNYLGESAPGVGFSVQNLTDDKMVYASAYSSVDDCESTYRQQVRAEIKALPDINFTASEPEICGETTIVQVNAQGDDETVYLINEDFEVNLGGFTVQASAPAGVINSAKWQRRQSVFSPIGAVWKPAISSGITGNSFVMATSDFQELQSQSLSTYLISPVINTSNFDNLTLKLKMYFSKYYISNPDDDYVEIEYSTNGVNWSQIPGTKKTQDVGQGTRFENLTYDLTPYINQPNFKFRISYNAFWADGVAVDNIQLFGKRPLAPSFSWDNSQVSVYTDQAGTIEYQGQPASEVYIKPKIEQLEQYSTINVTASAVLSNGCSAIGSVVLPNNTKVWNPDNSSTDWASGTLWKPANTQPTADNCVIVRKAVILNSGINGLAKDLTITNEGAITIEQGGTLKITNFIDNQSTEENFLLKDGGSLVQINDNAPNSGGMKAEKNFNLSAARKQYNLIMSPVEGQDIRNIFGIGNIPFSLIYNEATDYFVVPSQSAYTEKRGFASKEPVASVSNPTAAFSGGFTNGFVNLTLKKSAGGQGFNLIGNPYPSNLDMKNLYDDPTNAGLISSSFYFWDNRGNILFNQLGPGYSTYDFSNYVVYNAASNMGNPAGTPPGQNLQIPNRNATVGSGFLVQALQPGTLHLKNIHRTLSSGFSYTGKATTETEDDRYWLSMTTPIGLRVMTAITYFEGGNNGFGVDDSEAMGGSDEIFTMVGEHHLAIQGKAPFVDTDVVKLGYRAWETGINKIEIFQAEGVFANGQTIYIRDKALNNAVHNLSNSAYYFKTGPGEVTDRFEIIYRRNPLFSSSGSFNQNKIRIDKIDHNIVVTSDSDKITEVEIFSLSGIPVYKNEKVNSNELKTPNKRFGKQLLVVVAKTDKGEIETRMIEVKD